MKTWPQEKPKGAIVMLTHPLGWENMEHMLKSLELFFLRRFKYPVIIFHEKNYEPYVDETRRLTNASLFFQEIKFSIPEFVKKDNIPRVSCSKDVYFTIRILGKLKTIGATV